MRALRGGPTPWLGDGRATWLADVEHWISTSSGPVVRLESVKERPWGAVLRAVSPVGPLFFKAAGPLGHHEPVLISDLAPRWPDLAPHALVIDLERGWMLLADHGSPMSATLSFAEQVAVLEGLLPTYSDMQAATTAEAPRWLACGAPDRRVDRVPELLHQLLDGGSPIGRPAIDDADRTAYLADLPLLTTVCAELSTTPVAQALDHADLHGTNVLIEGPRQRLIDWGDSCITHPFCSLFVPLALVVASLPGSEQRSAAIRLRDAYLEPWGSTLDQRQAMGLAVWVAPITRAVAIAHETLGAPGDHTEIADLLRSWHSKRSLLNQPDEILQPT